MTDTEPCRADLLDLAYPYAMDAVAEIERRHIDDRIAGADSGTAAAFAAAVRGIRETLAALSAAEAVNPPPTLESKILRAIDDSAPPARHRRRAPRRLVERRRLVRLAVAAAVVIGVGAGTVVVAERIAGTHTTPITAEQILGHPDSRTRVVELPVGGTLRVSASDRLAAAAVIFDAVPAPPPGQAYQLWVVSPGGTARSAGVLTTVPSSVVATGFGRTDVVAVTIEPANGSPRPTSPQLATVELS
ncbi:anti-sigma factor [Nocardia barduliensis]|uniref:anti-sigma factor n=1 Tax=Nocardia barduliensis TaxID=2736643 RepID=UPI0015749C62|nr:anti-sigma factor [Nocardia barduliensis]